MCSMKISLNLLTTSSKKWLEAVLKDFDSFLLDHAANERKASSMALSMVAHYPDRPFLVKKLIDLAIEELNHYKQVVNLLTQRGLHQGADEKDPYVNALIKQVRKGSDAYFLDRLLLAAIVEARGAERFAMIAQHVEDHGLEEFYRNLALSEEKHHLLFIELAERYFQTEEIRHRLAEWLIIEQDIIEQMPLRSKLH